MSYGYGHGSWIIVVIPLALLAFRALSSGRRRSPHRPPAPPSFFVGQPPRPGSGPEGPTSPGTATDTTAGTPAGWFRDPFLKHEQRYWSGAAWTEHVLDDGVPGNDPPPPAEPPAGEGDEG